MENRSEVARMRERIEAEYQAACNGLYGLSVGSARHEFINARMQRGAERILKLIEQGKEEQAIALMSTDGWGE